MINLYETVSLFDEEEIITFFRSHPAVLARPLLVPLLVLFVIFFLMFPLFRLGPLGVWLFLILLVIDLFFIARRTMAWYGTFYILTNKRLFAISRHGLFKKSVREVMLAKIASLGYGTKGMLQTIFGLGTVELTVRDGQDLIVSLVDLYAPQVAMDTISRQVHEATPPSTLL